MTITSPLDIAWTHAYWVEGPEFLASRPVPSGGLQVGSLSLKPPVAASNAVATWPDEVGTLDLSQATALNQPQYDAAHASWGKPAVTFNGSQRMKSALLGSPIAQPFDVVVIARRSVAGATFSIAFDGHTNRVQVGTNSVPDDWLFFMTGAVGGGTPNTSKHLIRARADATDAIYVDESLQGSGAGGTTALDGVSVSARDGFNNWQGEIVFVGVKAGGLSAGDISDLHAWSQSYYSTP